MNYEKISRDTDSGVNVDICISTTLENITEFAQNVDGFYLEFDRKRHSHSKAYIYTHAPFSR